MWFHSLETFMKVCLSFVKVVFRPGPIWTELSDRTHPKHYGNTLSSLRNETRSLDDGKDLQLMASFHELRIQETENKQFVDIYIYIYIYGIYSSEYCSWCGEISRIVWRTSAITKLSSVNCPQAGTLQFFRNKFAYMGGKFLLSFNATLRMRVA